MNGRTFQMLAVSALQESPLNPRKQFGAIDELAESIRQQGVLQPLLVRPAADGGFEIAAGHRRYRASVAAGLGEVPAVVQAMDDARFLEVLTFENLHREDLHPLEEAAAYRTLMSDLGYDVAAIAAKLGKDGGSAKSTSHVYARLKLLDLTEEAQQAFLEGKLSAGHAVLIARLQPKDQAKCLNKMKPPSYDPQHVVSVRELANFIRQDLEIDLAQAPFPIADVALVLDAGACDSCGKRSGNDPTQAEPAEKDLCQDPGCYKRKVAAQLDRQREELRAQGEFVELSTNWTTKTKGLVPGSDWDAAGEREKGPAVKTGLVVEGHDLCRVLRVKVKEKPQSCDDGRGGASSTGRSAAQAKADYEKEQAEQDEKRKAEREARVRVLDAILREVKWPLGRAVVQKLLAKLTADCDCGEAFDARHEGVFGYNGDANEKALAKMPDQEVARIAVEFLVGDEVDYTGNEPDVLMALARAYGVDYRRLHDDAETKLAGTKTAAPKSKAVKKAAPKKPAAKKPAAKKPAAKKGAVKRGAGKK